jgi:hypothetical protein
LVFVLETDECPEKLPCLMSKVPGGQRGAGATDPACCGEEGEQWGLGRGGCCRESLQMGVHVALGWLTWLRLGHRTLRGWDDVAREQF